MTEKILQAVTAFRRPAQKALSAKKAPAPKAKPAAKKPAAKKPAAKRIAKKPDVSERGHAKHVMGSQAKEVCEQILTALRTGPHSFALIHSGFPVLTESQLRYQIGSLRDRKLVEKTGARELTLYSLVRAAKKKGGK